MKGRFSSLILDSLALAVIAVPVFYALHVFPSLPDTIATHYNLKGEPDAWSEKSLAHFMVLPALSFGLHGLLILISKVKALNPSEQTKHTLLFLRIFLALLFSGITFWMIFSADQGLSARFFSWLSGMLFLLQAGIGWFFKTLEPNDFVGIRTSYTQTSRSVWSKTHHTSGSMFILVGIAGIALSFWMKGIAILILALISMIFLCVCSWCLSRFYFRNESEKKQFPG